MAAASDFLHFKRGCPLAMIADWYSLLMSQQDDGGWAATWAFLAIQIML